MNLKKKKLKKYRQTVAEVIVEILSVQWCVPIQFLKEFSSQKNELTKYYKNFNQI